MNCSHSLSRLEGARVMETTDTKGRIASPRCLAGEVAPDYLDPMGVDREQARDVARWRKAQRARPFTIGVGLLSARLTTIYPQPHDIPLDVILTEEGVQVSRQTR